MENCLPISQCKTLIMCSWSPQEKKMTSTTILYMKLIQTHRLSIIHMPMYIPSAYKLIFCIICFKNPKLLCLKLFCTHVHSPFHLMMQIIFEVHIRKYHDGHPKERNTDGKQDYILFQVTKIKSN